MNGRQRRISFASFWIISAALPIFSANIRAENSREFFARLVAVFKVFRCGPASKGHVWRTLARYVLFVRGHWGLVWTVVVTNGVGNFPYSQFCVPIGFLIRVACQAHLYYSAFHRPPVPYVFCCVKRYIGR